MLYILRTLLCYIYYLNCVLKDLTTMQFVCYAFKHYITLSGVENRRGGGGGVQLSLFREEECKKDKYIRFHPFTPRH